MKGKKHIVWFSWKDIHHPLAGGAEVVTDQLLTRLVADGHEAMLLCSGFKNGEGELEHNGYKIIRVGNRLTVYFQAWRYFRKNLKQWATFLVDECNTMPFFVSRYAGKTPGVMFFHMLCREIWFYELPKSLGLIGYIVEPLYLRLLRKWPIITISESTKADLVKHGFDENNITIISEGITIEPAKDLESLEKYKEPTVLSLGSIRSMKRTIDQLEAFEIAKKNIPNLKLKVAGDMSGEYGQQFKKAVEMSPYKKDIQLFGKVSQAKKIELMQRSHLLLVTSVKEGWGLVVTEAASQGTPSVVYDVDGLRDSVRDRITGRVTCKNPKCLAVHISKILVSRDVYKNLRLNGYAFSKVMTFDKAYSSFTKVARI